MNNVNVSRWRPEWCNIELKRSSILSDTAEKTLSIISYRPQRKQAAFREYVQYMHLRLVGGLHLYVSLDTLAVLLTTDTVFTMSNAVMFQV